MSHSLVHDHPFKIFSELFIFSESSNWNFWSGVQCSRLSIQNLQWGIQPLMTISSKFFISRPAFKTICLKFSMSPSAAHDHLFEISHSAFQAIFSMSSLAANENLFKIFNEPFGVQFHPFQTAWSLVSYPFYSCVFHPFSGTCLLTISHERPQMLNHVSPALGTTIHLVA